MSTGTEPVSTDVEDDKFYSLPTSLKVNGREEVIRWEYTAALDIIKALNDADLKDNEKVFVFLYILYENFDNFKRDDYSPAFEAGMEFINHNISDETRERVRMIDFEHDFRLLISAINRVAGMEVRTQENIHWWTFLGWFMEIGECTYSNVLTIRRKLSKGEKLEKWEKDFFNENKKLVLLQAPMSEEDRRQLAEDEQIMKELFG